MRTRFFFIRVVSAVILPITEFHHKFTIAIVTLALPRSASRHYIYKIWAVIIFLLKCHTVGTVLLYLTLYIIYTIKVMSLQNWYPRETSLLFTGYVPCLSGNVSVFAFRNYNLDRKLKTQIWSLWKHKIKTHK